MKKRIFNNRPIVFFALAMTVGIFVTSFHLNGLAARLLTIAFALIAAGALFLSKRAKYAYIPAAFILGIFLLSCSHAIYLTKVVTFDNAEITATISTEIIEEDDYYYFEATAISVCGQEIEGNAVVFTRSLPDGRAGDKLKIRGDISTYDYDLSGYFPTSYHNKDYYRIYADSFTDEGLGELPFADRIRISLKRRLYEYSGDTAADITSALMFGDKYAIDEQLYENVKSSGMAHIFAVSGLHMGILAAVIYFILKKLRANGLVRFIVTLAVLMLYGGLCGYPSSVLRAIIMTAVFMLADAMGQKRDNLNSLALAAIIVLIIFPTDLFQVGFQLSFSAVLGIIMFARPIESRLKYMPKTLKAIVATSIAVSIMTWPILIIFFNSVQPLYLLANILLLPILPFIYILLMVICLIVSIIPSAAPVMVLLNGVTWPIYFTSTLIGNLSLSSLNTVIPAPLFIGYYASAVILSRFVFIERSAKIKFALTAAALSVCFAVTINCLL